MPSNNNRMMVSGEQPVVSEIETLTSSDVISCLWSKNSTEKCRIGLADIVLYEFGSPVRWYVTGKTGEVVKKRSVDFMSISDRWQRISSQNNSSLVAVMRQQGGLVKFLGQDAFQQYIRGSAEPGQPFQPVVDGSVMSLHCFIKGNNNNYYRNRYELKDKLGRYHSSTFSYNLHLQKQANADNIDFQDISMLSEDKCHFTEVKAAPLKNIMDLATNTIVRYIEMMLQVKVLSISADYVIDTKSQLWLMWTSDVKFVRGTNISEMMIPGLSEGGKLGGERMSWAGRTYIEGMKDMEHEGRLHSPSKSPTRTGDGQHTRPLSRQNLNEMNESGYIEKVNSIKATAHITTIEGAIDDKIALEMALKGKQKPKDKNAKKADIVTPYLAHDSTSHPNTSSFPQAFKCKGDYCDIRLQTVGNLSVEPEAKAHVSERYFTSKEIEILRKDSRFNKMMEYGADGPAFAMISMKSVILARDEHRGLSAEDPSKEIWNHYPITPRQMQKDGTLEAKSEFSYGSKEVTQKQLALEATLANDKEHIESFTKRVASYYEDVRVCGCCYNIYSMLDWARDLLGKADAHGAWKEGVKLGATSTSPNKKKNAVVLSSSAPLQQSSIASDTRSNSPGKKVRASQTTKERRSWKDYAEKESKSVSGLKGVDSEKFADLDDYLRGGAETLAARRARQKEAYVKKRVAELQEGSVTFEDPETGNLKDDQAVQNMYRGTVLLAFEDTPDCLDAKFILEEAFFDVEIARDGRQAINMFMLHEGGYDCILVQRNLPLADAFFLTQQIRESEKVERKRAAAQAAAEGRGVQPTTKRHAVICYTNQTSADDLKQYMKADMDGCVSFPVNKSSLLNTIRAAIPHHLATIAEKEPPPPPEGAKVYKLGSLGEAEGSLDSATIAAKTLPISNSNGGETEYAFSGIVQIDADTRVPYMVLDAAREAKLLLNAKRPFFNLIVCHDLFDTAERFKIFLKSIVLKYLGIQVLLWNYPGQAFTEWREEQLLNNEYHAMCLNEVLGQVGEKGTKDFDTSRPFYILGYGHGTSIAQFYASHYRVPNLRGIISVNGWSYLDSYLAGVMHDCINIFQCSPPSRPDLPVYFFSRFLFSKDYLAKVSVPLALNIYTAVHNPISLTGRINLCKGVLQAVDVRLVLKEIDCPLICIHSTQDSFARSLHTEAMVLNRGGEVRSIYKVLQEPEKTCVVWVKGGHECFQECRKQMQLLLEQVLVGFHETHDISFPPAGVVDKTAAEQGTLVSNLPYDKDPKQNKTVEDMFIDSVIGNINKVSSKHDHRASSPSKSPTSRGRGGSVVFTSTDPNSWNEYSTAVSEDAVIGKMGSTALGKKKRDEGKSHRIMDPTNSLFEKQDSVVYGKQMRMNPNIEEYPEVKEYMSWRLKRNKKRLQRLQAAARIIQGGFRAFMARQMVRAIRRRKAATKIQRAFRGWIGRCEFLDQSRRIWASLVIQRSWRGYLGRRVYFLLKLRIAAAANIQRVFRGHRAREFVNEVKRIRGKAASIIQALFRRNQARKDAFRKRLERNCCITIQRVFRGHRGRRRANAERDKYIFSRSQSHGIEFGRQMLLEHKLHATKLQSDVTLLTQEKVAVEERVEALLEEISSFEEGVRTLEKEMHQLSKVESEAAAFMDEESKTELREQKMKLDKEFGSMLAKIGDRKDLLLDLERQLGHIDKARQSKDEELRMLERKLVVLLEEQQNELNAIKRKQDVRGALLAASHEELMKASATGSNDSQAMVPAGSIGGGGGGPSLQEKKQAAQLMQSTETLMKFGFMSMSMTYFSSLNMIKALRTVSAQDTVMAALADVHSQRAVGFNGGNVGDGGGKQQMLPDLKPGQLAGQESLRVTSWSVQDVAKWLQTLSLGQYAESFIDAAIDGEFLYDINDDDLKNTLGIEHRLHRKKILNCVHRLKLAEAQKDERLNQLLKNTGSLDAPVLGEDEAHPDFPDNPFKTGAAGPDSESRQTADLKVPFTELVSFVRHSKFSLLKDALDFLPNKKFDKTLIKSQYVVDHGTVYVDGYERLPFHLNKTDEHGNSLLSLAAQNGNLKIAKYLISKGANINHQSHAGQTAGHYAIAYKFFELSQWLFENGGNDQLENKHNLSAYDGLSPEDEDGDD